MKLKFLGTGTSQGVPVIGCHCRVCASADSHDRRTRTSAMVTAEDGTRILIDCGPDFRMQMLENREENVDAVLLTHEHNDHVIGLDDLRPLIFKKAAPIKIFAHERVCQEVKNRFPYAFAAEKYPGAPSFDLNAVSGFFNYKNIGIETVLVPHFKLEIFGYKIRNLAYITDASAIPEEAKKQLQNIDHLILNCIRKTEPHPAHFILPDILKINEELNPKNLYLTHLSHHFGLHAEEEPLLPAPIRIAYDGLQIEF